MFRKVRKYIEEHSLLDDGAKVVVALSGGADSVALLHILIRLNYSVDAIHCNFHLRGEESMRDEMFVRELCEKMGVSLVVENFDTAGYAAKKKISIEMAARELRYDFFEKIRSSCGAEAIAVAHHKDDIAETMLLNMIRGTGIKGLHGIQAKNGYIVRPLLCVCRNDILDYLNSIGEKFVTDSSNLSSDYTRNKIRLEILPLMREINPSITETLAESASRIAEAEKVYMAGIGNGKKKVFDGRTIDIDALMNEPSPLSLLHEILSEYGFNGAQSEDIMNNIDGVSGKEYSSATHILTRNRRKLILSDKSDITVTDKEISLNGSTDIGYGIIDAHIIPFDGIIDKNKNVAMLDYSKLKMPLRVRNIRNGDRFYPFGMRGSKAVSDYLTDLKVSLPDKRKQLTVVDSENKILWLVGERTASHCAVNSTTTEILKLVWNK